MLHSILIADERMAIRTELRHLLEKEIDLYIAGETGEIYHLPELARALQPDILILNIRLTETEPYATLENIHIHSRQTQVILIAPDEEDSYAQTALRKGVAAYVLRDACLQEMTRAVRTVLAGHRFLGSPFYDRAVETYIFRRRYFSPDPSQMLDFEFQHFYT